nr:GTP-binding protein [Arthrospira sp. SH-MAG29]
MKLGKGRSNIFLGIFSNPVLCYYDNDYHYCYPMIFAIAGPPGAGKTYWIREQIAQNPQPQCYFTPEINGVCIDQTCLATEFPHLHILSRGQETELLTLIESGVNVYIELPCYWELSNFEPLLNNLDCQRIAVLSKSLKNSELEHWSDQIIDRNSDVAPSQELWQSISDDVQIHQGLLSGEIIDWASLTVFWFELIHGAYGQVIRAKGIFDIVSGESIYGDFVFGTANREFVALDLPIHTSGRPDRFSGFEIIGQGLDKQGISQTIKDCCLPESHIHYYQQQMQESLAREPEVLV